MQSRITDIENEKIPSAFISSFTNFKNCLGSSDNWQGD